MWELKMQISIVRLDKKFTLISEHKQSYLGHVSQNEYERASYQPSVYKTGGRTMKYRCF